MGQQSMAFAIAAQRVQRISHGSLVSPHLGQVFMSERSALGGEAGIDLRRLILDHPRRRSQCTSSLFLALQECGSPLKSVDRPDVTGSPSDSQTILV
jgi:hypothetical protein